MLSKALIGFLSAMLFSDVLFRWTPVFGGLTMMVFTLLDWSCALGARSLFGSAPIAFVATLLPLLLQGIGNSIIGMAVRPGRFGIA
jgi:hypothetical protein